MRLQTAVNERTKEIRVVNLRRCSPVGVEREDNDRRGLRR